MGSAGVKPETLAHARRACTNYGNVDGGPRRAAYTDRGCGALRETSRDAGSLYDGAQHAGERVPRGEGHWVDAVEVMDRRADDARAEKLLGRRNRDTTTMSPDLRLGRRAFQQSRKLSH